MPAWLARSYPRSTAVQEVAGSILRSGISLFEKISSYSDSSRAAVEGWQKDGHLVLEAYPRTV